MTRQWDVVIVGGGLSGFVAANYLAKAGLSILLLERANKFAGRARTDRMKQQDFNLGPHALYKNGVAKPILKELGVNLNGKSPKTCGTLIEGNFEYSAPFSPLGVFTTKLLNWKERVEWMKVLLKVMTLDKEKVAQLTFEQWVKKTIPSTNVQSLLYLLGRLSTYCHAPELASAKVILSHLQLVAGGVLYLDNGWQSMIDQLHNKAVLCGVQVQTHTTVKQIFKVDDHFKILLSTDEEIFGKYVLSTTGPDELSKMLPEMSPVLQNHFSAVNGATLD
ncbi:FAD-dependent oxidoreductase [Neobacillus sp. CF12]|uniref:phytoene desaturase family protein n=1 Tax=Neobacillus sp. CF12 TaxID=3055864 RepID=UPI0025A109EC|nr:FAD-dependent oxidoreductase [Neobacillus sp. CF12]MDM5328486.1 FAD-dependent oxidoreductase [Neobacillus sp. CF12]